MKRLQALGGAAALLAALLLGGCSQPAASATPEQATAAPAATEAPAPEYPGHAYADLTEADGLLVSDDVPLDTTNLTPSGIACPAGYTLWQNHAPTQVQF